MKKLLIILFLFLIKTSILLSKENEGFYLECKTKNGPTRGYGLMPKQNLVMVPHPTKKFDFVILNTTSARYEFEYKTSFANIKISINRLSGELTEIWSSEDLKKKTVFKGKCVKRDLDKPKF